MNPEPRIVSEFARVDPGDWERLEHADNPFLSHAFLGALESSGALDPALGWNPCHLALYDDEGLAAFAPTYLKTNSHGEFVFDWSWADAYRRHGVAYYPKLLTAIPYSPVAGPRLLTRRGHPDPAGLRAGLAAFALELCQQMQLSTWHCNFVEEADARALTEAELLPRQDWQYHWRNRDYADFDEFVQHLKARKRKNILRERRQLRESGVRYRWLRGSQLGEAELDFVYACYCDTFRQYGNHAALNRAFFATLAVGLGERLVVAEASLDDRPLAMSLYLQGGGRLYGRYWGCVDALPGLHFETAYYQGIEFCIDNGLSVFESGAQGEHKIARGFQPCQTHSFHYVRDPAFREAIGRHLERERQWVSAYREQLDAQDPFRSDTQ